MPEAPSNYAPTDSRRPSRDRRRLFPPRRWSHLIQLVISMAVLVVTSLPIQRHRVGSFEARIFRAINGFPDWLYWPMWTVMQFGNLVAVPVAVVAALLFRQIRLAVGLAVAGLGAWLLGKVIKVIVVRGRPAELLHDVVLRHAPAGGHGYVSGHAAVVFALMTVAHPYLPRPWRIAGWIVALLVCVARIYVGAHLPLDVVGGAAMGWALGSLVHLLIGAPQH